MSPKATKILSAVQNNMRRNFQKRAIANRCIKLCNPFPRIVEIADCYSSFELINPFSRIAIWFLGLNNGERNVKKRKNNLQFERTNCLNRRNVLQFKRTNYSIRGNEFQLRENRLHDSM